MANVEIERVSIDPYVEAWRKKGYSYDKVAHAVGVHPRTVARWIEKGSFPVRAKARLDALISEELPVAKEQKQATEIDHMPMHGVVHIFRCIIASDFKLNDLTDDDVLFLVQVQQGLPHPIAQTTVNDLLGNRHAG